MSELQIHIGRHGQRLGPYTVAETRRQLANNEVSAIDLAWHEGLAAWQPLGTLACLAADGAAAPPVSRPATPQDSPLAIASLTCGIAGVVLALVCGFFSWLPSLAAIICGHLSRTQIKKANGTLTGDKFALTGLILGYAALALSVLVIIIMFAMFQMQGH
ncbi:MAG: DUF4190 domain-containing protein [Verrucomicrobiales bacterium]|jgi:hypothetical protein|nr:DUF4190 domain-containing protein [Verrucomicrobiales bacterium]